MSAFHIVFVAASGYHRAHSFTADSLKKAACTALDAKWRRPFASTVLREGATGCRFSMHECALIARKQVAA